jgi:glucokinase
VHIPIGDLDFRDRMVETFPMPVALDNDANAAAIAEWKVGAGRGTRHMIMLTLGTGVGGGLILDGKPYRGFVGAGAEIGHMVLDYGGEPCGGHCTGHGHLEQVASGGGRPRGPEDPRPDATGRELVGARARETPRLSRRSSRSVGGSARRSARWSTFSIPRSSSSGRLQSGSRPVPRAGPRNDEGGGSPARRDLVRVLPALLGPDAGLVGAGFAGFEAVQ